jgi:hypothetical protein
MGIADQMSETVGSPMKLQLLVDRYARALRVIGQDLADLFPGRLEIELVGQNFVARGCRRPGAPTRTTTEYDAPQKLGPAAEAQDIGFMRSYTPEEIDRLDELGRARRTGAIQIPDLYSLSERLRMIGRILDEKNARLVSVCQSMNSLVLRYRDADNATHQEEYSILTLYKLQQQYYSGRCFKPKQPTPANAASKLSFLPKESA